MSDPDSLTVLVRDLAAATPATLVNPYACFEADLDRPSGAAIRAATLLAYLEARPRPALLLVGEAAGYQGCRFSGIAFTSERSLPRSQWTSMKSEGWQEPSATIVHGALADLGLEDETILWNAVPFHPAGATRLTNRAPTSNERREGSIWLWRLIDITRPAVIAAIGRTAGHAVPSGSAHLRHPAYGGATQFRTGLASLAHTHGLAR